MMMMMVVVVMMLYHGCYNSSGCALMLYHGCYNSSGCTLEEEKDDDAQHSTTTTTTTTTTFQEEEGEEGKDMSKMEEEEEDPHHGVIFSKNSVDGLLQKRMRQQTSLPPLFPSSWDGGDIDKEEEEEAKDGSEYRNNDDEDQGNNTTTSKSSSSIETAAAAVANDHHHQQQQQQQPNDHHYQQQQQQQHQCSIPIVLDIDMTPEVFVREYLYTSQPVLIRPTTATINHRGGRKANNILALRQLWTKPNLVKQFGKIKAHVGSIPYSKRFGLKSKEMSLREYVYRYMTMKDDHDDDDDDDDDDGHSVPVEEEHNDDFEDDDEGPPYFVVAEYNEDDRLTAKLATTHNGTMLFSFPEFASQIFAKTYKRTSQFFLGPMGSGAPLHFHNYAFSLLVYGEKRWTLLPPSQRIFSKLRIKAWKKRHAAAAAAAAKEDTVLKAKGMQECIQRAGDLLFVPKLWAHGVENLEDSISIAVEWGMDLDVIASTASDLATNSRDTYDDDLI